MAEDREDRSYGPANSDPCLKNRICLTHGLLPRRRHALHRYRFGLAALLIPLGIRAIPEIIVGPYPVGWDTIAFYVPGTLDWAAGKAGFLEMLGTAPLMYMISVPIYALTLVNPVWIFKVMGPVLYGASLQNRTPTRTTNTPVGCECVPISDNISSQMKYIGNCAEHRFRHLGMVPLVSFQSCAKRKWLLT